MEKLDIICIDEDMLYEFIKLNLHSCRVSSRIIENSKYHHQTKIERIPNMLKNGILSKNKFSELEGRDLTDDEISIYSDDCHVNGTDYVSVSSMDLDFSTMGKDEYYWDPIDSLESGIVVSSDIRAFRVTKNYFNEFLVEGGIYPSSFSAIDTKVLKIYTNRFYRGEESKTDRMLRHYHTLKDIALSLKEDNLDIPLREVSDEVITLDIDKVIKLPSLKLK